MNARTLLYITLTGLCLMVTPAVSAQDELPWRTYEVYRPRIERFQVTPNASHDSTIAWFGDRWIAQWDGGSEQPGQRIYQSTSTDIETWAEPIEVYFTAAGSVNPIEAPPDQKQWQPGFVKVGDELWSFWVTSGQNKHALYFSRLREPGGKWEHREVSVRISRVPTTCPAPMR